EFWFSTHSPVPRKPAPSFIHLVSLACNFSLSEIGFTDTSIELAMGDTRIKKPTAMKDSQFFICQALAGESL
ncbi:MAG TPA: hypothetical protein PK522_11905, partial [Nitrosomonas sp.]|nr:hypothetical protein [Nitrosomonas sp.]